MCYLMPKTESENDVGELSGLTVLEIAGLVKQLEEKWGVTAAPRETALTRERRKFLQLLIGRCGLVTEADVIRLIRSQVDHISANLEGASKGVERMIRKLSNV
jgi:hypothetical protein